MKKFDFKDLRLVDVQNAFVVTYEDKILTLDGKRMFSNFGSAKAALKAILIANYHQGHYWHKDKDNTFAEEGGQMRNGGKIKGLDVIFEKLGKQLTEEVLGQEVFVIKKLQ